MRVCDWGASRNKVLLGVWFRPGARRESLPRVPLPGTLDLGAGENRPSPARGHMAIQGMRPGWPIAVERRVRFGLWRAGT